MKNILKITTFGIILLLLGGFLKLLSSDTVVEKAYADVPADAGGSIAGGSDAGSTGSTGGSCSDGSCGCGE